MKFFKKNGRYTDEEKAVISQIMRLVEAKGLSVNDVPLCSNLDELIEAQLSIAERETEAAPPATAQDDMVQTKEATPPANAHDQTTQTDEAQNDLYQPELSQEKEVADTPAVEESKRQEVDQTDFQPQTPIQNNQNQQETPLAREASPPPLAEEFGEYDPFAEEIIERSYNAVNANTTGENAANQASDTSREEETVPLPEAKETPVDNINPNTKLRAAQQTADVLLKGYAKIVPQPFKWLAKIDEAAVEKLEFEGQIDISIEVSEGMTFDDYMKQTNAQVDELFEVEQDTLDEIREPLVEVLMEQELELTPQQRLGMAVFSHLIQMLTIALKLRKQNNRILAFQRKITQLGKRQVA